jgi:hypothetical protein
MLMSALMVCPIAAELRQLGILTFERPEDHSITLFKELGYEKVDTGIPEVIRV